MTYLCRFVHLGFRRRIVRIYFEIQLSKCHATTKGHPIANLGVVTPMQRAIEAVRQKEMGWLLAAKTFGVPQATLRRHALGENKILSPNTKGLGRYKLTFPPDVERTLVEHLKFLEARLFGLTRAGVQELAFELAEKNGFAHRFNL